MYRSEKSKLASKELVRPLFDISVFRQPPILRRLALYPTADLQTREVIAEYIAGNLLSDMFPRSLELVKVFRQLDYVLAGVGEKRHFVHQFEVFLLGSTILSKLLKARGALPTLPGSSESDIFRGWMIAALFHDLGKPTEKVKEIAKALNKIYQTLGSAENILSVDQLPSVTNTALEDTVKDRLEAFIGPDWKGVLGVDLHGYLSAGIVLGEISPSTITSSALSTALAAIVAHVFKPNSGSTRRLRFEECPFAYLLFLLDNIQEWERDPVGNPDHISGELAGLNWSEDGTAISIMYQLSAPRAQTSKAREIAGTAISILEALDIETVSSLPFSFTIGYLDSLALPIGTTTIRF